MKVMNTLKKFAAIGTGAVMLGATLTGALAQDLKDYPKPFVTNGIYDDSNVFVVGDQALAKDTLAAMNIAAGLQFMAKTPVSTSGTTVSVTGGKSQQVPLGMGLSDATFLDKTLQDDDVSTLFDGKVTFKGTDYDTSEEFQLCGVTEPYVATSLDADDDYKRDVFFYFGKDKIKYAYKFDKSINLLAVSNAHPLEISFLGKTIKITNVTASSITAKVGDEYTLNAGQSVTVAGKVVKLENVGSTNALISIDGVSKSVSTDVATSWNGLEVYLDSVMNRNSLEESAAIIVVGKQAIETYNDGDAFVNEDPDDPNWVWDIAGLGSGTSAYNDCDGVTDAQVLRIENDFVEFSKSDNPHGVGKCVELPNGYLSLCLDSLTVADADYASYDWKWDNQLDVADAGCDSTFDSDGRVPGVSLITTASDGIELRPDVENWHTNSTDVNISTTSIKTKEVYFVENPVKCDGNEITGYLSADNALNVFYKSTESPYKMRFFGAIGGNDTASKIVRFNYGNTKDDNIVLYNNLTTSSARSLKLKITPDTSTDMAGGYEQIVMSWGLSSGLMTGLGATVKYNDAGETQWKPASRFSSTDLSGIDKDQRTNYGIVVLDPKGSSTSDEVKLLIPNDIVKANIVVKGSTGTVSSSGTSFVPSRITPVSMVASQVTEPTNHNLIVVGGPCANSLAGSLFGLTCDGWPHKEGVAVVKLVKNGEKVAMLVAGTTALDTQRAGKAVANYDKYAFSGAEKLVKGTTLQDITVE